MDFIRINDLRMKGVIGEFGLDVSVVEFKNLVSKVNSDNFHSFIENNYTLFNFGDYEFSSETEKALFARFVVNVDNAISNNDNIFNGTIYIPYSVEDGELQLVKSNYLSRMAFIPCKSNKLGKYSERLKAFDSQVEMLFNNFEDRLTEDRLNVLMSQPAIFSQTVSFIVKARDGYIYSRRGHGVLDSGKLTIFTGIVDKLDLELLIKEELREELGVVSIEEMEHIGNSIVFHKVEDGFFSVIYYNMIVRVDLTYSEVCESFTKAVDMYENEDLLLANTYEDLMDVMNKEHGVSVSMRTMLSMQSEALSLR